MNMHVVLDIETDSLDATVVHCIVAKDRQTGKVYSWKEQECYIDFPLFCSKVDKFIMHNGISFDAPVLNKLLGTRITLSQLEDTLILSQLTNPSRDKGHSLNAWGERLNFSKIEFNDFSSGVSDEMIEYFKRDVDLTERVWITSGLQFLRSCQQSIRTKSKREHSGTCWKCFSTDTESSRWNILV